MNYSEFINNVVGIESFSRGYSIPLYFINYRGYQEEKKEIIHYFIVKSSSGYGNYNVEIRGNGKKFYSAKCTCPQYKKNHTCKHIAACMIRYNSEMEDIFIIDKYEESQKILDLFYEAPNKLNIKEKLDIEVGFEFYQNDIYFKLLIGKDRKYTLNTKSKLSNFSDAYYNGGDYKLGVKLTFNPSRYYFDDRDKKIIEYLFSFRNEEYYNSFSIKERDLDYLMESLNVNQIKINNNKINSIIHDFPSKFVLNPSKESNYELSIEDLNNYVILTNDCKYILYDNNLYILDENYSKTLVALGNHSINSIWFNKKDITKFSQGILKKLKDKIVISEDIKDIETVSKPVAKIYIDILRDKLQTQIKYIYNNKEINFNENSSNILRDYGYEEEVMQDVVNSGFNLNKDKLIMEDIENIGNFLENELTNLGSKYEVYTSKKLDNISLISKSRISKDFSIGSSGIMSFDFQIDNINLDELKDIFKALESKKTYHKLKNGNIINVEENEELKELKGLVNDLDIDYSDLTNSIEVPKYRALYIDSLKSNKYHDIKTNNTFNKFIKTFTEFQNVQITLDENDEKILRDYQKSGVKWLYTLYKCDLGGILADEMGLGKSLQTICFLKQVLKENPNAKCLIVCPTALVYNWEKEFDKFANNLKYKTISDYKAKRIDDLQQEDTNIFITSYGLLRNDVSLHEKINYDVCIIDEAQYIKNHQAGITIALKKLNANHKLALTGTPLENSVIDLWSIFDFLMPGYLNSVKKFHEKYHISDVSADDLEKLEKLNYQIKPFILRRKKKDVYKDLPDKIENNIYLELPEKQKMLYLKVLKETEQEMNELVRKEGFRKARFKILQLLTKLRQICIEPSVLYANYDGESIKTEKLIEIVKNYAKEGHKILIFSSFRRILDVVKEKFTEEHISFYYINGSVNNKARLEYVNNFNEDDTNCFLITLKAGGTGLNLTSADIVIHLDIWWNPQAENQATDRAHRIGQEKKVIVNKIITKGTIEERILELQNKKRILSENLIEGHNDDEVLSTLNEEDFKNLLSYSD